MLIESACVHKCTYGKNFQLCYISQNNYEIMNANCLLYIPALIPFPSSNIIF